MIKLNTEYLKQIFTKYDYIMTTAQLNLEKLYYRDIQQMLKKGMIEKVKRGYYHWIEDNDCKEVVIINNLNLKSRIFLIFFAYIFKKYI